MVGFTFVLWECRKITVSYVDQCMTNTSSILEPVQTLWRCYAAEKPCGCAATWKMYVLTPEAVTTVESDNSGPYARKLNISVII